jgi:type IV secretory pathway TraG/TraD family ATPase VirD4
MKKHESMKLLSSTLESPESCVVVDPEGRLAAVTGEYRKGLGEVIVFNPFDFVPLTPLRFGHDVHKLADALVNRKELDH